MEGDREQRNQSATIHVGNLDSLANEDLLWELCYHFGPVERVHIPRDKVTGDASGFGFVEFSLERDAEYASKLLNGVKLFNRSLRVNKATTTAKAMDGRESPPQISRDLTTLKSMGYGFLSYDNFAASDAAVEAMNDQFVLNKQIRVMYAFKKGTTERHGSETERLLAQAQQGGYTLAAQFTPSGANQVPVGGAARV
ncbi:hypothetical protein BASA82_000646 [Batrachochytrium salamandrivorans]|nr:hypothetical protein BASA82_000646 [Batrachochytrium salamandrivorans]